MAWRLISSTRVWDAVTNTWKTVTSNRVWDTTSSTWKTVTATYVWAESVISIRLDQVWTGISSSATVAAARDLAVNLVARVANVTTNLGAAFAQFIAEDRTQNKAITGTPGKFFASVARGLVIAAVMARSVTINLGAAFSQFSTELRDVTRTVAGSMSLAVARGLLVAALMGRSVATNISAVVSRTAELRDVNRTIAASASAAATRAIHVIAWFSKSLNTNISAFLVFSAELRDVARSVAGSMSLAATRALVVVAGVIRPVTTNMGAVVERITPELRDVIRSVASSMSLAATRVIHVVAFISRSATANMSAVVSRIASARDSSPFSTGLAASTSLGASSTLSLMMVQTTGVTIDAGGSFTTFSSVDARPNPPTNPSATEDSALNGNVDCSWSNAQTSHDNNVVNRAPDNGSNAPNTGSEVTLTQTLGPTTTTYDDNSQLSDGTYWYRYGAKNTSGVRYSSWTSVELGGNGNGGNGE